MENEESNKGKCHKNISNAQRSIDENTDQ